MKHISLIGSTGSIGRQTLDVCDLHRKKLKIVALASGKSNLELFASQVQNFEPDLVALPDAESAQEFKRILGELSSTLAKKTTIEYGEEGLINVAAHSLADTVVTGVVGFLGLKPTIAAIKKGKIIALANKETLVAAGTVVMPLVKQHGAQVVPVDSEHSAIFQALADSRPMQERINQIGQLLLTGSGGPFRTWSAEQIAKATVEDALKHPNWSMGPKITIDSATLMNKGLEVIEARWLFDVTAEQIKVVIHPQSILHSAVEFVDGSIVGQFGVPDMRLPIHYAIFYPERVYSEQVPRLNLAQIATLTFEEPDLQKFPCLALAKQVAAANDTTPCILNAANEVAVKLFLDKQIKFTEIPQYIERVLNKHNAVSNPELDDILEADRWARQETQLLAAARN